MRDGRPLRLGTRGSRLALAQAALVAGLVSRLAPDARVEVVPIRTAGDAAPGETSGADRKSAFTREIDRQLLEGKVDLAVHSMKDIPTSLDRRLVIAATPPRGDARDALVTASGETFDRLPPGAVVGTSSVRRKVQLGSLRTDIRVADLRGNVETRIGKMKENGMDGVVLAAAGLQRLGLQNASQYFEVGEIVPAACQGIIAVEARADDQELSEALRKIDDGPTNLRGACERAFLRRLGGDCNFPAGVHARIVDGAMEVVGMIADPDGSSLTRGSISGQESEAKALGTELAERLVKAKGGAR